MATKKKKMPIRPVTCGSADVSKCLLHSLSPTPAEHISISATFPAVYSTLTPHAFAVTDEGQGAAPTVGL